MAFTQVVTPNPEVPCKPRWCLTYVDNAFNLAAHGKSKNYPTAISAWNASTSQHRDRNFPADRWVPVWFTLKNEPAGHVAILAPDGAVWSSSHPTSNKPVRHGSLNEIISYYGSLGLTYIGWTEDVGGVKVIKQEGGDMEDIITDKHRDLIRVISSEVKGWNRDEVHSGKLDDREMKAWKGNKISVFSQQAWNEGGNYRALKDKWKAAYDAQPGLLKKIEELNTQLKAMPQDTSEAEAKLQAIKDALDIK